MTRCSLSWRCPRRKKTGLCCSECGVRDTCQSACLNSPERCLVARAATIQEEARELNVTFVKSGLAFQAILETGKPLGMFWRSTHYYCQAIDNRSGEPVLSEKYEKKEDTLAWLIDRAETAENDDGRPVGYWTGCME